MFFKVDRALRRAMFFNMAAEPAFAIERGALDPP